MPILGLRVAIALTLCLATALPAEAISFGAVGIGGTGCDASVSASSWLDPGSGILTVVLNSPAPESTPSGGVTIRRTVCNIAIPVDLLPGETFRVVRAEHRGYLNIPTGAASSFGAEYFFSGFRGPTTTKSIPGPFNDDFTIVTDLSTNTLWAPCGADVILRTNPSMRTTTPGGIAADAADQNGSVALQIQVANC